MYNDLIEFPVDLNKTCIIIYWNKNKIYTLLTFQVNNKTIGEFSL